MKKLLIATAATILVSPVMAQTIDTTGYDGTGDITQGRGTTLVSSLYNCKQANARNSPVGEITGASGTVWTVPAETLFESATKAINLYDDCTGNTPGSLADVNLDDVPVVTIDEDGKEITGYLFADNYFELYINGQLVGVDAVPFTPFNSSVVKFKVKKPYQIAVKLVDWEENLGIGSERGRGGNYSAGDGGFIASFSDGTVTGADWSAQTFYTSPVIDLSCLSEDGSLRTSSSCEVDSNSGENDYGVHWAIPTDWASESFDSSAWPTASTYTEETIGVSNKDGYMNFIEKFSGAGAEFIWSSNVVLDNLVLVRYQVK